MATKKPKLRKLKRQKYLAALALFTLANKSYADAQSYQEGLFKVLGLPDDHCGHLLDEVYMGGNFKSALERDGFDPKPPAA